MDEDILDRWRRRLERAAALLSERLDDPPSLTELASAAAVSPFHFHRIWRALTHETVAQTTLRLRMEVSQELLLVKDASVTQTALAVGFGTPQSFARAFRRHTGLTPSEHRDSQRSIPEMSGRGVKVKDLQGIYGILLDDPATVPEDQLRYDACLALGVTSAPEPFRVLRLPAGEYACLRHFGSYDGLEAATQHVVSEWLPSSGREPADSPIIHHARNDPDQTPVDDLVTDILLPLQEGSS